MLYTKSELAEDMTTRMPEATLERKPKRISFPLRSCRTCQKECQKMEQILVTAVWMSSGSCFLPRTGSPVFLIFTTRASATNPCRSNSENIQRFSESPVFTVQTWWRVPGKLDVLRRWSMIFRVPGREKDCDRGQSPEWTKGKQWRTSALQAVSLQPVDTAYCLAIVGSNYAETQDLKADADF